MKWVFRMIITRDGQATPGLPASKVILGNRDYELSIKGPLTHNNNIQIQ